MTAATPTSAAKPGLEVSPGDPSMADILASIRRILTEDDQRTPEPARAPYAVTAQPADEILVLDHSMRVREPAPDATAARHEGPIHEEPGHDERSAHGLAAEVAAEDDTTVHMTEVEVAQHAAGSVIAATESAAGPVPPTLPEPVSSSMMTSMTAAAPSEPVPLPEGARPWRQPIPALAEPDTVTAAASALNNLARSVAAERTAAIQRNGLSIEDVVREEVRPLLKAWLDTHLPGVVERLVQAEIERVVNRATF